MLRSKTRAGELDREIIFVKSVTTRGDSNEDKVTGWVPVDTDPNVFAKVTEIPGTEIVVIDQITYSQRTQFEVYYRTDITVQNRIYYNTKVYSILSINEDGRNRFLKIMGNLIDVETT